MARKLIFSSAAWRDFESWTNDGKTFRRINLLLKDALRTPMEGLGKPKALTGDLKGFWSRRIDDKHRIVYRFDDDGLEVMRCRTHYGEK